MRTLISLRRIADRRSPAPGCGSRLSSWAVLWVALACAGPAPAAAQGFIDYYASWHRDDPPSYADGHLGYEELMELLGRLGSRKPIGDIDDFWITGHRQKRYRNSRIQVALLMLFDLRSNTWETIPFYETFRTLNEEAPGSSGRNLTRGPLPASEPPRARLTAIPEDAAGSGTNVSRDRSAIVGYVDKGFANGSTPYHAFRWTEADGLIDLGTVEPARNATLASFAVDVSSDGSVVVGHSGFSGGPANHFNSHAFRWTRAGGMVDLGTGIGPLGFSAALAVSGDGSVVVGHGEFPATGPFNPPPVTQAFRWTQAGGMQRLGALEANVSSFASGVSVDGRVVVGMSDITVTVGNSRTNGARAFRWTQAGGLQNLGALPGHTFSAATAVSDDGTIVVGVSSTSPVSWDGIAGGVDYDFSPADTRAFYWTVAGGLQDLTALLASAGVNMTGRQLVSVTGMTPDAKWLAAVTTGPDPDVPGEIMRIPVLVSLTEKPRAKSRLLNLSTRGAMLAGDSAIIPGFVLQGTASKRLLIRTVGPRLADFGVVGVLANPAMTLKRLVNGASVDQAANDNWGTNANAAAITSTTAAVGAFPLNAGSADAALLLDLAPGQYTVVASGVGGTTGIGIVELYDADPAPGGSQLINIATRGFVGTGESIMIPGFVVSDDSSVQVLVRAAGPTLGSFGVPGVLGDPRLTIVRRNADNTTTTVATNDNWGSAATAPATAAAARATGAFALANNSRDAAAVVRLGPGVYTVLTSGVNNATGVALVEVYVLP